MLYEVSIREMAWMAVAKKLFKNLPKSKQRIWSGIHPDEIGEVAQVPQVGECILKWVEIEALSLERSNKRLPVITDSQMNELYKKPLLFGSLISSLEKIKKQSKPVLFVRKAIENEFKIKGAKASKVQVSRLLFESLLRELHDTIGNLMFTPYQDQIAYALSSGDYEECTVQISNCEVSCNPIVQGDRLQFIYE